MKKRSNYQEDFFLEESVSDSWSRDNQLGSLELPLSRQTFVLILCLIVVFGLTIFSRIFFLNVIKGDFYQARAATNAGKEVYEPAQRGLIYDRFGKVLAENQSAFSVMVKPEELLKDKNNVAILSQILEIPIEEFQSQLDNFDLEKKSSMLAAKNIDPQKIIQLEAADLAGIEVVSDFKRLYPNGEIFSQALGYVGQERANEISGKTGLEAYYDQYLKGADGVSVVYRDAVGKVIDKKNIQIPESGKDLNTTIDADFQKYFYNRLAQALSNLGRKVGVGIAINPQNGEILSMVGLPSFDNNIFSKNGNNEQKNKLLNSPDKPLFNRAVSGLYAPGSTVKPLVGIAALKEGVIDPQKKIYSAGYIEVPNPYDPAHPSRFNDWQAHGWVDLHSAIARSSDVYFYEIGGGFENQKGLGIDKLKEYWEKFGFGKKTGIDLMNEKEGFLPSPEEKEKRKNDIWRVGDTYNVSIGQGDLLVTPIQLISQISSIANGGKFYKPHFLKEAGQEVLMDFSDLGDYIKEVKIGMEDVVQKSYGTANLLSSLPIKAAGKTGTSQINNNTRTNAFFVGYMPAENPQVAILILVENSKEGSSNTVPVAKDILEWYYYNRLSKSL